MSPLFLPCLYRTAKPQRVEMVLPVIKYDTNRTFLVSMNIKIRLLVQNLRRVYCRVGYCFLVELHCIALYCIALWRLCAYATDLFLFQGPPKRSNKIGYFVFWAWVRIKGTCCDIIYFWPHPVSARRWTPPVPSHHVQ